MWGGEGKTVREFSDKSLKVFGSRLESSLELLVGRETE